MNIQEHLMVFDGWLTGRLEEAYAERKDLAFRDTAAEIRLGDSAWEYTLLAPGGRSPRGDGWSVYRLQGVWPDFKEAGSASAASVAPEKKSLLGRIAGTLLGANSPKLR
jgi:hypothetical protein